MDYSIGNPSVVLSLLTKIAIYGTFIISFNVFVVGKTGYWAVGHLASFGVAALVTGIVAKLAAPWGSTFVWGAAISGILAGGLLSLLPAVATFRLHGDYFILVSIALCEVVRVAVEMITGPGGLSDVPRPFGIQSDYGMFTAALVLMLMAMWFAFTFRRHRLETLFSLTRAHEALALTCGIDVQRQRAGLFLFAGALAGAAGALFAFYTQGTDPHQFTLQEAVELFVLALLSGVDSIGGSLAASTLFVLITFSLQSVFQGAYGALAPKLADIVFGVLLIVAASIVSEGKEENAL